VAAADFFRKLLRLDLVFMVLRKLLINKIYTSIASPFKGYLGGKTKDDIGSITAADITGFRDQLAARLSAGTVNVALKILRSAFAQARGDGLVDLNEAERVSLLKRRNNRVERRPFTLAVVPGELTVWPAV
jgi:hypothetical protein